MNHKSVNDQASTKKKNHSKIQRLRSWTFKFSEMLRCVD